MTDDELAECLARDIACLRHPDVTMDGAQNPRPSETIAARRMVAFLRFHIAADAKAAALEDAATTVIESAGNPRPAALFAGEQRLWLQERAASYRGEAQ